MIALGLGNCYYDNEELLYGKEVCDEVAITYAGVITGIISRNCLSCHSSSAANGGVVLETYAQLKVQADNGKLLGVISHTSGYSPMPKNGPQLSDCNILAIRTWIEAGALNE